MKRILVTFAILLLLLTLPVSAAGVSINYNGTAVPVQNELRNGVTYVPLRAFCDNIGSCSVSWINATRQAKVSGACSLLVSPGSRSAVCGGSYVTLSGACYITDGSIWVPVRALAAALECEISWVASTRTVKMTTDGFIWLARIIEAEASGEPYAGKIAVGNVVLNRVASSQFPNSIYDVIFDSSYGGQFTPVNNGTIYCTPSAQSIAAARACIAGENTAGNSLYFFNPDTSTRAAWIEQNRTITASIGDHVFYN